MLEDLIKARSLILQAQRLLRRHFSKRLWPYFYEDTAHLIKDISDCLATIRKGGRLPL